MCINRQIIYEYHQNTWLHNRNIFQIGKSPGDALHPSYKVNDLEEGEEYLFRVTANTNEGPSEPLVADCAIKAKNPWGPPGPPRNLQLCDWDADRLDLSWKVPEKDGGAPITHYIMEMREADPGKPEGEDSWKEVGKSDGPKCFFSMGGLVAKAKYQFRARSANKGGISDPCEATPILTPKARKCKLRNQI